MDATQRGVLTLLKSAVTGRGEALPEDFSLEAACRIMNKQSLLPLAFEGAHLCGISESEMLMQRLFQGYCRHLVYSEGQLRSLSTLLEAFEKNGVDYLPVKGCLLKGLYPKPELRSMGDADILIRQKHYVEACRIMGELGFVLQSEDDHVFYWKSPALSVELHKCLAPPMDRDYYAYYGTGWHLAVQQAGCRYELSTEDHYVFLFAHFARHYRFSGIGCRHVLDLYVYRRQYPEMDSTYIHRELKKLALAEFHENILRLLAVWFDGAQTDAVTEFITDFIFSGGTWGNWENHLLSGQIRAAVPGKKIRHTKLHSALRGLFPAPELMQRKYPILQKMPILLPLFWILRILQTVIFRREAIAKRQRIIETVDDEKTKAYRRAMAYVGLDFGGETR